MKKFLIFIMLTIPAITFSQSQTILDAARDGDVIFIRNFRGNINKIHNNNMTALMVAARNGQTEAVKVLIQVGAIVNEANNNGWTALMHAAIEGRIDAVKALIEAKADVNKVNKDGNTALMLAARWGQPDAINTLVTAGANVNTVNKDGWTALMFAASEGRIDAVKALLEAKADINAVNKEGATAFKLAKIDNIRILLKADYKNTNVVNVVNTPNPSADVDTNIPEGYSIQSNAIAVVIGNRDYQNGIAAVDYALQDERIMKRYFESAFKIPAEQIISLENITLSGFFGLFGTEKAPTKSRLYRNVQNYNPDTVYVYYSGHGIPGLKDHKGYLAPVDVDKENVEETAYSLDLLYSNMARLKKIGVRHIVVILESCFSGDSEGGRLVQNISPVIMKVDNPLTAENIGSIYAATSGSDYSVWYPEMGHGLFTYYFLKGLSGEADQKKNRKITLAEMRAYLEKNVPKRANILRAFEQMPQVIGNDNEVLVRLK